MQVEAAKSVHSRAKLQLPEEYLMVRLAKADAMPPPVPPPARELPESFYAHSCLNHAMTSPVRSSNGCF